MPCESWYMDGDWYRDAEGYIYIVPEGVAECHGPDNETMDAINAACREHDGKLTATAAEALGLESIPVFLRRWDEGLGYYHA